MSNLTSLQRELGNKQDLFRTLMIGRVQPLDIDKQLALLENAKNLADLAVIFIVKLQTGLTDYQIAILSKQPSSEVEDIRLQTACLLESFFDELNKQSMAILGYTDENQVSRK